MRVHLSRIAFLFGILLLIGEGCYPFTNGTPTPSDAGQPVNIVQPQPADCGQRNPNKLLPHFSIPNPNVIAGQPMYIDASCSVGKIVSLRWDFDTQAWSANLPAEQRFLPEVAVVNDDKDWPANYQPPSGWPLNNSSPFFVTFIPTEIGSRSMRLWAKDWQGNEQVVMATYTVRPSTVANQAQLNSNFVLYDNSVGIEIPKKSASAAIPYFYGSSVPFEAKALGSTGDIASYEWTVRRHGIQSGVVERKVAPIDPFLTSFLRFQTYNRDNPQILSAILLQDDYNRGFGKMGMTDAFNPRPREEAVDFSIELKIVTPAGEENKFAERYTLIDASTVKILRPQMALAPGLSATVMQNAQQLNAWKSGDVPYELEPGQTFILQNYSLYPISERYTIPNAGQLWNQLPTPASIQPRPAPNDDTQLGQTTGEVIVEFDPGNSVYQEIYRVRQFYFIPEYELHGYNNALGSARFGLQYYYNNSYATQSYTAPTTPGVYTTRLRLTQLAVPGLLAAQQAETTIKFRVREPAPTPAVPVPLAPPTAQSAPTPQAPTETAHQKSAPVGVRAEVNPISQSGQTLALPIHPDDILQFLARGISLATMQRVEWDFDGDGTIDETCNVTEPYAGAGWATCQSSAKVPPQTPGDHTARLTIVPKTGAPYSVTVQYNVVPDDRAAAAAAIQIPSISPELYAENKNGVRMQSNPEIYQNDSIIFLLNGLTEVAKKVQYDFENDGTYDVNCDVRQNQGQLQCLFYRRVSWRTAPGDYVARIKVIFAGNAGQLDFVLPYSVVRGERPADKHS